MSKTNGQTESSGKPGYAKLYNVLVDDGHVAKLSGSACKVFLVLLRRADANNQCFPGRARLAADAGVSIPAVKRAIRELIEQRVIERTQRTKRNNEPDTNLYTIVLPPLGRITSDPTLPIRSDHPRPQVGSEMTPGGVTGDPGVGSEMTPGGVTSAPQRRLREGRPIEGPSEKGNPEKGNGELFVLDGSASEKKNSRQDDVSAVWSHYKTHRPKVRVLSEKVRGLIVKRLKEGFTVDDLKLAVDGNFRSPHHCGQNDTQTEYHNLELIVRDTEKVQMFIDLAESADKPVLGAKSQLTARAGQAFIERMQGKDPNNAGK